MANLAVCRLRKLNASVAASVLSSFSDNVLYLHMRVYTYEGLLLYRLLRRRRRLRSRRRRLFYTAPNGLAL